MSGSGSRRMPVGAETMNGGGVHFRVWAPGHDAVSVSLDGGAVLAALQPDADGYFSGLVRDARPGSNYVFRLADGRELPDPASRFQPAGPHGPSQVVDPDAFPWTDRAWAGPGEVRHVVYEMHIGTFTAAGTWLAAAGLLPEYARLGITTLEIMPVAEFPGRFNWGYDVAAPFAPAHAYGSPDDMRAFVDRAHALGLAVILDVVYNHLGPDGCYLPSYSHQYVSARHRTDWGDALNFDGPGSAHVRAFFLANVEYWIREFHLDGLRFDATQNIYDSGSPHILAEMVGRARAAAAPRRVWLVAENEPQDADLLRPAELGGFGMDAAWNDDFHHSARVALTGRAEAYYQDHRGAPQEFVSAAKHGFLFQGQYYSWQRQGRGTPALDVPATRFVTYLENHDQVANSAHGSRLHQLASPARLRAMTALLLLQPAHAMLFQGQEFAASSPWVFFADHEQRLARRVYAGRREFLTQFPSIAGADAQRRIADPAVPETFARCRLDHGERGVNEHAWRLHADLIRLSREDPVFAARDAGGLDGAVIGPAALVLRLPGAAGDDRLLIVNLGDDIRAGSIPEPLLAPPRHRTWELLWSSEDPAYGGGGTTHPEAADGWRIAGNAAVVLAAVPSPVPPPGPAGARQQTAAKVETAHD
jgi:maltooligosyltrehalose trehalohydrolase